MFGIARRLCVAALAFAVCGAPAAQPLNWKAGLFGPPRSPTEPLEWWAHELAARSGGQVKVELVYGEALAKATEIPDAVRAGAFELGMYCPSYYPGKFPLFSVLDLPFLAGDDTTVVARAQLALAQQPGVAAELERWNTVLLMPLPLPQYQIMSQKPVARAEDFKGLRVRASGEMARVLEDYGAVKSLVPAPEVYTSLERGVIDAVTFPATYAFYSYRIHEVAKYFIDKVSLGVQPCFFGVNSAAWRGLSDAQRKLMLELREAAIPRFAAAYANDDAKYNEVFRQKGIRKIDFPAAERAKLVANAQRHWREWADGMEARGLPGKAVLELATTQFAPAK
jgi:TRAP-type C4-dicarboxylate transport system substrate-binding protein